MPAIILTKGSLLEMHQGARIYNLNAPPCGGDVFCTAVITKHGYRSQYDVSKLMAGRQTTFNNVELVVASCATSSSARGTMQLLMDGVVVKEFSEVLQAPVTRQDDYDRYNLTLFFDRIRRRLSASITHDRFSECILQYCSSYFIDSSRYDL